MDAEKKILIVDDNEAVLIALEYSIQQAGYTVFKASDGMRAFEIAQSVFPDIIVSDITMPEMDGFGFCKKVRSIERLSEVPFIFLTAHGEPDERVKGLRSGADDYMVKPFDIEELIVRIDILYKNNQKRRFSNTLSGNLKELPIVDALQIFAQSKKEGYLNIKDGINNGYISFRDGDFVDASFTGLEGEDALIELMQLTSGNFHYEPQDVVADQKAKSINHVIFEVTRLIDEREELKKYIPDFSGILELVGKPSSKSDPDVEPVLRALDQGAATGHEIRMISGLSIIRTSVGLAKLFRDMAVKVEKEGEVPFEPVAQAHGKTLKVLFAFIDESSAVSFITKTSKFFHAENTREVKGGKADFIKINVFNVPLRIFSFNGEKKFSFLWEPMISSSDVAIFLQNSSAEVEHIDFFREKLKKIKEIPFFTITTNSELSAVNTRYLECEKDIASMFLTVVVSAEK